LYHKQQKHNKMDYKTQFYLGQQLEQIAQSQLNSYLRETSGMTVTSLSTSISEELNQEELFAKELEQFEAHIQQFNEELTLSNRK